MKKLPFIKSLRVLLFIFLFAFICGVKFENFGWGGEEVVVGGIAGWQVRDGGRQFF